MRMLRATSALRCKIPFCQDLLPDPFFPPPEAGRFLRCRKLKFPNGWRTGSRREQSKDYDPRCSSIPPMLVSLHILAGVLLIKRSNKAVTPTKPGALEQ